MKLRLDIENKILIPFMILTILPITILGVFSYWNGYQLLLQDRVEGQEAFLNETAIYLETVNRDVLDRRLSAEEAKAEAISYLERIRKSRSDLAVIDENGIIMGNRDKITDGVLGQIRSSNGETIDIGNTRYLFQEFEAWEWIVVTGVNKSIFPEELITIQKYTLLLTIIFLVLAMQSIIFIAHCTETRNLRNPG